MSWIAFYGLLFKRKVVFYVQVQKVLLHVSDSSCWQFACSVPRPLHAGTGDVAGAIEGTWNDASDQIKTVVNNVVFPVIDLILAVFFFAKLGMAYFDYRKHGQFEWTAPAILFACLLFTLTAPTYVWTILGM